MQTEHIFIGDEFAEQSVEPTNVTRHKKITNRVNGTVTELTFYEEGFLRVREERKANRNKEHVLELRFLDPDPTSTRRTATMHLWLSLAIGLLALIASFVLPMSGWSSHTFTSTGILATASVVSLLLFIYRSEVYYQFRTASGQAIVLTLTGSFGCVRKLRAIAATIRKEIAESNSGTDINQIQYLRAEMKAHYKLAETGVITREACADGTTLILSKFG